MLSIKHALHEDWKSKCEVYVHKEQDPISEADCVFFKPADCYHYGFCCCGAVEGSSARPVHFRKMLTARLKTVFCRQDKAPSPALQLLQGRMVFLAFTNPVSEGPEGEAARPSLFLHVAYMNFTTWRFAGLQLHVHEWKSEDGVVVLKVLPDNACNPEAAAGQVVTDMEFYARVLNLQRSCSVSCYVISTKREHWPAQVGVNLVPAIAMQGFPDDIAWGGPPDKPKQKQGKKRPAAKQPLDELELAMRMLPEGARRARPIAGAGVGQQEPKGNVLGVAEEGIDGNAQDDDDDADDAVESDASVATPRSQPQGSSSDSADDASSIHSGDAAEELPSAPEAAEAVPPSHADREDASRHGDGWFSVCSIRQAITSCCWICWSCACAAGPQW